ncbi:hypothetical protein ACVH9Z_20405 [Rhodococcus opacus]|nr:tetrahydromethanopterin S-methyltransferase subunit B [Rhodococcus opacus]
MSSPTEGPCRCDDRTSGRATERRQLEAGVFAPAAFGSIATTGVVTLLALIAVLVLI